MLRLAIFAVALCIGVGDASGALLGSLQVEGLEAPLAVAADIPRFSWRVVAPAEQLSYRIVVTQTFPDSQTLWDSGAVASNASWLVPYGGATVLPADADLVWTVSVALTGIGVVSASAPFSTAPAAPLPGAWLGLADTLRTSFSLAPVPIVRARLHASGAGCFHAYVNGARVSPELAPGFGHAPSARMPYLTFDAALLLAAGAENVVALRLGSCKFGTYDQYCDRGSPALCNAGWALLSVTQDAGSSGANTTTLATSGVSWRATNTSIVRQHLYDGEVFDARLEQDGWNAPGFSNASAWPAATEVDTSDLLGPLSPLTARPVVRAETFAAASVTAVAGDGCSAPPCFVFDLGPLLNTAGFCELDLSPPPGQAPAPAGLTVSLLHAEGLLPSGAVWNWYLTHAGCTASCASDAGGCPVNCAAMNATYITRGGGRELFRPPHFSYFGFRWVQLDGWPYAAAPPNASALTCHFTHTALPLAVGLAFPQAPALDALQRMVVRTHLSNLVSVPTDCPQREKRGWTGDAQLTAHSAVLNFDSLAFYEAWWQSMLDQQRIGCLPRGDAPGRVGGAPGAPIRPYNWVCDAPMVPNITLAQYQYGPIGDVLPREQVSMGNFAGDPSWEVAAIVVPYELLTQAGDTAAVAAGYDGPKSLIAFFSALGSADAASNGLLTWSYLGDWKALDTPNNKLVANINYIMALQMAAEIAAAAGADADALADLALERALSAALQARFWNASARAWDAGSQSAQILGLAAGAGSADVQPAAAAALVAGLAAAGGHLTFGASGARFALAALHGPAQRPDLALALALEPGYPGWAQMVANATLPGTMWEDWSGPGQPDGSSDNHIFKAGAITPFLLELALGLDFAMRLGPSPLAGAWAGESFSEEAGAGAACACEAGLDLPLSLHARLGLSCAHAAALCDVVAETGGAARPIAELRAAAAAALARRGLAAEASSGSPPPRALRARLALTVTEAAARRLGAAAGWRATPVGNASFAWEWTAPASSSGASASASSLSVRAIVPFAADARLEVPLALFGDGGDGPVRVSVSGVGGGVFVVGGDRAVQRKGAGAAAAAAWRPVILDSGAGAAARHVSGLVMPRGERSGFAAGPVLLLRVPGGAHELVFAAA